MRALIVLFAVLAFSGWAGAASAATTSATTAKDPNALSRPDRLDRPPLGHKLTGRQAIAIALRVPKIAAERHKHPKGPITPFLKGGNRWQVSLYDASGKHEVAQVLVDDTFGTVLEAWTGPQVAWTMTRGYPGAFGRKANALYIWIPLLVLFVVPFLDWRRPFRIRHLDLLVLCSLSISLAFFNHANLGGSVPSFYPPLLYLFGRLAWIGLRRERKPPEPLKLLVPATWLAVALVFLVGFRIGLNVTNSNVIDVGYAGVIGADRLTHGEALYGNFPKDNPHGDTYGPVTYAAYVPFEQLLPWHGRWDDVPAAHAAAVVFDLLCIVGLFLLGRRIRGPTVGIALAYAWVTFPFTLFTLESNANDGLVAALLIGALLAAARPALRGMLAALAGLAKFAPLAVAPVLATHTKRGFVRYSLAFAATAAIALLPVWLQGDPRLFYDQTVGFQAARDAPLSVWGLYDWPHVLQVGVQVLTVAFAFGVAVLPRRRDVIGLAALMGAVLIALQLGATYWFYLYIEWFFPLALVALIARDAEPGGAPLSEPAAAAARSSPPALAASSG
jgi:hypothetical protein